MKTNHSLSVGTVSGTVLSVLPAVTSTEIVRTIILAAIGATVSFVVSYVLRWWCGRYEK